MATSRDRLLALLRDNALQIGNFALSSGGRSDYKIDCDRVVQSPEGLRLIGVLGALAAIEAGWRVDVVGGPATGADPIAGAIAPYLAVPRTFSALKQSIGDGALVNGNIQRGDVVLLVDDVLTTGGSLLRSATLAEQIGARVGGVVTLVTREQGGESALAERGYLVRSLYTARDIRGG